MVVELANLRGDLADLPALEVILGVQDVSVLLLKAPKPRVSVKGGFKVGLPTLVADLWQIPVGQ